MGHNIFKIIFTVKLIHRDQSKILMVFLCICRCVLLSFNMIYVGIMCKIRQYEMAHQNKHIHYISCNRNVILFLWFIICALYSRRAQTVEANLGWHVFVPRRWDVALALKVWARNLNALVLIARFVRIARVSHPYITLRNTRNKHLN